MELRLTDGTTTVTLSGTDALLRRYTPQAPDLDTVRHDRALGDGGEQPVTMYRNVTEEASVALEGTLAEQRATLAAVNRLFGQARQRQRNGMGDRVYVEFQPVSAETWYRSEVLAGRVMMDGDVRAGIQLAGEQLLLTLVWTRRYYWEGALTELVLGNDIDGDYYTDGVTVRNDGDNWADIDGDYYTAGVTGDLPAPLRLDMTNSLNEATFHLAWVWIAHNVHSNPAALSHHLEAEGATGGTTQVQASCSGGEYQQFTWATDIEELAFTWELDSALLAAAAGNWFQIMARFFNPAVPHVYWYRLALYHETVALWQGPLAQPDANFATNTRSLGAVQLPPWLVETSSAPLDLRLYVYNPGGGTLNLDYLQLLPTDSFAVLRQVGYPVRYGETLVWDGTEDRLYTLTSEGRAGNFTRLGSPAVMLEPGRDQRLYFLQHTWMANTAEVNRTLDVRAYYRPRRLVL